MSIVNIASKKVQQGLAEIFSVKEYPIFLSFASHFLHLSWENILLLYQQRKDAVCVAGLLAWEQLTHARLLPKETPLLLLYPEYQEEASGFSYSICSVFDIGQLQINSEERNRLLRLVSSCNKETLYPAFRSIFQKETGKRVYPLPDSGVRYLECNGNIVMVPSEAADDEKLRLLLEYYLELVSDPSDSALVSGGIRNTTGYLLSEFYGLSWHKHITFPYLRLLELGIDSKERILSQSCLKAGRIREDLDQYCHDLTETKQQ